MSKKNKKKPTRSLSSVRFAAAGDNAISERKLRCLHCGFEGHASLGESPSEACLRACGMALEVELYGGR